MFTTLDDIATCTVYLTAAGASYVMRILRNILYDRDKFLRKSVSFFILRPEKEEERNYIVALKIFRRIVYQIFSAGCNFRPAGKLLAFKRHLPYKCRPS